MRAVSGTTFSIRPTRSHRSSCSNDVMATFQAIETISDVLVRLLQASHDPEDFDGQRLDFATYRGDDFRSQGGSTNAVSTGVSLFLYRVVVNGAVRNPPGRRRASGEKDKSKLPLDLHYLFTVWAGSATMQHRIVGWLMRTLETTPIVPSGVLHGARSDVFEPEESIEIVVNDLTNEDLFRIWDVLGASYRLSVPYLVRNVRIETEESVASGPAVQRRIFDVLQDGGASDGNGRMEND